MKRIVSGILVGWALMVSGLQSARAQYDYSLSHQTNTINVASNWVDNVNFWYVVGDTTYLNALVIQNGGTLSDGAGYIGNNSGGSNNAVIVNGGTWSNLYELYVGNVGAGNSLVISNQGAVFNRVAYVGLNPGSSNNSVLVTGDGSVMKNNFGYDLYLGVYGAGNNLVISNHGAVVNYNGFVGYWDQADNNHVLVTGSGSVWSNQADLSIGVRGVGSSLVISDQGVVVNGNSTVGASTVPYSNNTVVVTGAGSVWENHGQMYLAYGSNGHDNSLVISNQGAVVDRAGHVGGGGASNSVLLAGFGSVWSNSAELSVGAGTQFSVGGTRSSLVISNGGAAFSGDGYVGSFAHSNDVLVTGTGSIWSNRSTLYVGNSAVGNSLVVSNQGALFNTDAFVGNLFGANSNSVRVLDGSTWINAGSLYLGYGGRSNQVTIVESTVVASNVFIGLYNPDWGILSNNEIHVESGNLFVTNAAGNGSLVVNRALGKGSVIANSGSIVANYLDIGGTGSVFATASRIRVTGATTNNGTFTMINSVGTFGTVVNSGAWITDPTTNIFNGDHIVTSVGYINAAAGDVYYFKSNFVNQSTQSNSWDTLNTTPGGSGASGTKFIFDGTNTVSSTGYTQQFFTAGLKLTGGFVGTPVSATGIQQVSSFAAVTGFVGNFALDRLEIGNLGTNSILELMDSFPLDANPAALFVNDLALFGSSKLIISNNVTLYFVNSNNWNSANYSLLGNGELHQLVLLGSPVVPEPSTCLLLTVGAVMIYRLRRSKHQRQLLIRGNQGSQQHQGKRA